jgi:protein-tyrosine-phosphatase
MQERINLSKRVRFPPSILSSEARRMHENEHSKFHPSSEARTKKEARYSMRILFVCKYNRFRSRVAEAYFNKINKNKKIKAESAGIIRGFYPLNKTQVKNAEKFGINIIGKPRGLSMELLKRIDLIVITANDVSKEIFQFNKKYLQKIIVWKIQDVKRGSNEKGNIKSIKLIIRKVNELVKELENKR